MSMAPHSCSRCDCQCEVAQRTNRKLIGYYAAIQDLIKVMEQHPEMPINPGRIQDIFDKRGLSKND